MAQKLSSLFFSTAKRIARMQRAAFKLAMPRPIPKPKKKAVKKKSARPTIPPRPTALLKKITELAPAGAGTWQSCIHKTAPSQTELLGRLAYFLYRPIVRPIAGMPLVVMLHGCQQTAFDLAQGTGMNTLADGKGFVVVYPQQAKRVQAHRCWRWFEPDAGHGLAEADAIADLIRATVSRYRLDRTRVYVAGLSAGAGMAAFVALRHPQLVAAVAMHSGAVLGDAHNSATGLRTMRAGTSHDPIKLVEHLVKNPPPFPGMPAIILHGQRDHVVSSRNATQLFQQFIHVNRLASERSGPRPASPGPLVSESVLAAGTSREYERADFRVGPKTLVRLCQINKVGHAWSGGDPRIKFNTKEGPKAASLIWQFFATHRREA